VREWFSVYNRILNEYGFDFFGLYYIGKALNHVGCWIEFDSKRSWNWKALLVYPSPTSAVMY